MQAQPSEQHVRRGRERSTATRKSRIDRGPQARARGLGWFSIGLGLAEIFASRSLASVIGVRDDVDTRRAMFGLGAREIAAGVGLLQSSRRNGWMWGRVAGDVMDLAFLGNALGSKRSDRGKLVAAGLSVVAIGVLDAITARQLDQSEPSLERHRVKTTSAVTINRPLDDVRRAWASFAACEPQKSGEPQFTPAPGGRGTEVRLPHGRLTGRLCEAKLRRLKQIVEIGEVVQSDAILRQGGPLSTPRKDLLR